MQREFVATIAAEERSVTVSHQDGDRWHITVGERAVDVDARRIRPGTWSLLIAGRSHVVDVDERPHGTAILHGLIEVVVRLEDARQRELARAMSAASGGQRRGGTIAAPIAGKVVKILVEPGTEVTAGHSVIVLEAMKMENEIKAEHDGTVEQVHVSPGQSVETGDRLVTLA